MSGIIKSGNLSDLASVRALHTPAPAAVLPLVRQDEEKERLRRSVATLEGELRERDVAIEVLRKDVERAFDDGMAKGRDAGLTEAADRQADRLVLLERSLEETKDALGAGLVSLDRLAALLARDCVEMILGNADDRAGLIARIVAAQVAKIDKAMLLGIEVSREDFADEAALADLAGRLAPLSVSLSASADLAAGGCVMVLRLGRMRVGLDQQWGTLSALLGEMAEPEVAP